MLHIKKLLRLFFALALVAAPPYTPAHAITCGFGSDIGGGVCRGYVVSTSGSTQTFNVPADWNSSNNKVEVIGGGGSGNSADATASDNPGAGGGAYATKSNISLTPGGTTSFFIGAAVAGTATATGTNGTDNWFVSNVTLLAKGGQGAQTSGPGAGGAAASCIPSTGAHSGGAGGTTAGFSTGSCSGGGGAAGLNGDGLRGGNFTLNAEGSTGGGGADAGSATHGVDKTSSATANATAGGLAQDSTAGGTGSTAGSAPAAGGAGSHGSGGGGAGEKTSGAGIAPTGGVGGAGIEWDATHGSGGGGGGGGHTTGAGLGGIGGAGGLYGGGGACSGFGSSGASAGGAGAQGMIVITYTPAGSTPRSLMFLGFP